MPANPQQIQREQQDMQSALQYRIARAIEGDGWQLRFDKVHDCLKVFAGNGAMISWPDRGQGGKYTWHSSDPVGEIRGIGLWVGDGDQIHLYAVITTDNTSGDHQCDMDTCYNGDQKQRWEFDVDESHDINR